MAKKIYYDKKMPGDPESLILQEQMNRLQNQVPTGEDRDGCAPLLYSQDIGTADAYAVDLVFGKKLEEGTNTSVSTGKLVDSAATFQTNGVKVGDTAVNVSDRTEAKVTAVSETELSLDTNIFTTTGKKYAVGPDIFQAPLTLVDGLEIAFKAANANTGASTLSVNGLTAVAIKKHGDQALVAGDILAGQVVQVRYDSGNYQVISQSGIRATVTPAANSIPMTNSGEANFKAGWLNPKYRFQVSGCVGESSPEQITDSNKRNLQRIFVYVPNGMALYVKRVRFNVGNGTGNAYAFLKVDSLTGSPEPFISTSYTGDVEPNTGIHVQSLDGNGASVLISINAIGGNYTPSTEDSWWVDFALE